MTTQVLSPSNNSNTDNNFLTKFWAVQRCGTLESPVIFTNWSDFNVYLNSHHNQLRNQQEEDDEDLVFDEEGVERNNRKQQGQRQQKDANDAIYEEFDNILDAVQYILPQEQPLIIPRTTYATTTTITTTTTTTTGTPGIGQEGEIPVTTQETKKTTMTRTPITINTRRTEETGTGTATTRTLARPNDENMGSPPNLNEGGKPTNNRFNRQQLQQQHQPNLQQRSHVPFPGPTTLAQNSLQFGDSTAATVDPGWRSQPPIAPPIMPRVLLNPTHKRSNSKNHKRKRRGKSDDENSYTLGVTTKDFYAIRSDWRSNLVLFEEFVKQFPPGMTPKRSLLSPELQEKYSNLTPWLNRAKLSLRNYYSNDRTSMSAHEIVKSKVLQQFCIQIGFDPITWAQRQQRTARSRQGRVNATTTDDDDDDNNTKKRKRAKTNNETSNEYSNVPATDYDDDDEGNDDDDEEKEREEWNDNEKEEITTITGMTTTEEITMEASSQS